MKKHTTGFLIFCASLITLSCSYKNQTASVENKNSPFVDMIDQQIPQWMNSMNVPGVAFALIEDGEVIFEKGYGYADIEKQLLITPETGFNIGSISKTLTAWGVLKLVDQGKINLDDPAEKYLTRWHLPKSEFDANEVTIRRILSHTAGLSVHGFPGYTDKTQLPTIEEVLLGKSNTNESVRIIQQPGMAFRYSGGGTTILQLIIEEVSGLSFEAYMQMEVFEPLGMNSTSFTIDETVLSNSSLAHDQAGKVIPLVLFTAKAAAGAHTNLKDFSQFALASLGPLNGLKQSIIQPETVALMTSLAPNSQETGLGYQIKNINKGAMLLVGHEGNNYGWNAYFAVDTNTDDGFVMLTNGGSFRNVYRQIECEWLGWKLSTRTQYQCENSLYSQLMDIYKTKGITAMLDTYKSEQENNAQNYHFIYGIEYFFNRLGNAFYEKEKFLDALEIFTYNYSLHPNSFNAYYRLAEALIEANKIDQYQKITEEKLQSLKTQKNISASDRAGELIYIGIQLMDIGAYEKAEPVLQETFSIRQTTAPEAWTTFNAQSNLGEVQMYLKKYKDAYSSTTIAYTELKKRVQSIPGSVRKLRMMEALDRVLAVLDNNTEDNAALMEKWKVEQGYINSIE
ncbi:serine hydrolase [Marinicella sp. W31]|uniref:serine hydrolase n=1 Tax=Marinicella sp. W31 TaxID=3023713 RepID=UPI003756A099